MHYMTIWLCPLGAYENENISLPNKIVLIFQQLHILGVEHVCDF